MNMVQSVISGACFEDTMLRCISVWCLKTGCRGVYLERI